MYLILVYGHWIAADVGLGAVFAVAGAVLVAIGAYVLRERPGRDPRARS
jgi:hypothetical protein